MNFRRGVLNRLSLLAMGVKKRAREVHAWFHIVQNMLSRIEVEGLWYVTGDFMTTSLSTVVKPVSWRLVCRNVRKKKDASTSHGV